MPNIALSFAVSSAILAFASFFGVFLMLQRAAFRQSAARPATTAMASFLLIGLTAVGDTIRYGFNLETMSNVQNIINNVAFFIAPPLLTAVIISIGWQKKWRNTVGWGIFLCSCLFFWIAKATHELEFYRLLLISSALLISIVSVMRAPFRHPSSTLFLSIAVFSYTMAILILSVFKITIVFLRLDLFHYLTALGNLFLASGFFQLMRKGASQKQTSSQ